MATRSLNLVFLIGNLTRDPELRYTSTGTAVATFTIATNRNYMDSTGKAVESAEFTNVVAWAKLAEICGQLLKKGMKVHIQGRLQTSKWQDKETGKEMRKTEVVATDMMILTPMGGPREESSPEPDGSNETKPASGSDMGENVDFSSFEEMGDSENPNGSGTPF